MGMNSRKDRSLASTQIASFKKACEKPALIQNGTYEWSGFDFPRFWQTEQKLQENDHGSKTKRYLSIFPFAVITEISERKMKGNLIF